MTVRDKKITRKEIVDLQKGTRISIKNQMGKILLRTGGFLLDVVVSGLLGGLSTLAIIGWYPMMIPGLVGLGGPIGYLILQTKISIKTLKRKSSRVTVISVIVAFLASFASYILGLYYGLAKIPVFGAGTLYGAYSDKQRGGFKVESS